jgi:ligand-binding SRPBCC domain-containing protein
VVRIYLLEREQLVGKPPERVFPFFARPENLALITPPSLDFRLLTPSPVGMERGRTVDYTIRILGMPVRWRTLISEYDPPRQFVDEQLSGPYCFWHHTHSFEAQGDGTLIRDRVRYALPLFLIGLGRDLVHRLYVRRELEAIFDYRRDVFASLFGGEDGVVTGQVPVRTLASEGGLT